MVLLSPGSGAVCSISNASLTALFAVSIDKASEVSLSRKEKICFASAPSSSVEYYINKKSTVTLKSANS